MSSAIKFVCNLMGFNLLASQWAGWSKGSGVTEESLLDTKQRQFRQVLAVQREQPDVACFQEVEESNLDTFNSELGETYTCSALAPNLVTSAKQPIGVATFINKAWKHQLEQQGCQFKFQPMWLPYGKFTNGPNKDQQDGTSALLLSVTDADNKAVFNLVNSHLDWGEQTEQLQNLATQLKENQVDTTKLVLVGDLNETWSKLKPMLAPSSLNLDNLLVNQQNVPTYFNGNDDPAKTRQCDHVLVSTGSFVAKNVRIPSVSTIQECVDRYGSDHVSVTVELSN